MITGESIPVTKRPGDEVIGATINKSGSFRYRATKVGKDTTLAQIIKMVESAQASKAPIQRIADKISSYFVPIVFLVAITSFIFWLYVGPISGIIADPRSAIGQGAIVDTVYVYRKKEEKVSGK